MGFSGARIDDLGVAAYTVPTDQPESDGTLRWEETSLVLVEPLRHLEYFHDHVRIERMLFDGSPEPRQGELQPDLSRPGLGLEVKRAEAERYLA